MPRVVFTQQLARFTDAPDKGVSRTLVGEGLRAEYMPPERAHDAIAQDVHRLAACAAQPDVVERG